MHVRFNRAIGLTLLLAVVLGCAGRRAERSPEELRAAAGWTDPEAQAEIRPAVRPDELLFIAAQAREARRPEVLPPKRSILVLTGGGPYGAYPAGVLCGWSETGTRPVFDVITGISTGGIIACFAFLGPEFDPVLRQSYTQTRSKDLYHLRHFPVSILSESLADDTRLARLIDKEVTDERIQLAAVEHAKGRRLYVGTTDLETRRLVVWDMGAIATRGDVKLFRKVLLASASIPAFFPPVPITVTVDGVPRVERHVDGGTGASMFFVPPWVPPDQRDNLHPGWLYGSDLYIIDAGKLYADPAPVRPRAIAIAEQAVSTIVYDQTRSDLHKLFLLTMLTGMNFHLASIPQDLPAPTDSTIFDPAEMCRLFRAGSEWARSQPRWRDTPPGYEPGEAIHYRGGTVLTDTRWRTLVGTGGIGPIPGIPGKK
jgi:predicted acylesterase/phospholipase RssA